MSGVGLIMLAAGASTRMGTPKQLLQYRPGVTLIDAGYGNNTPFLKQLETRSLTYLAAIAKNRRVTYQLPTHTAPVKYRRLGCRQGTRPRYFYLSVPALGQTSHIRATTAVIALDNHKLPATHNRHRIF